MELYDYLLWLVFWIMGAVYGWYARERHSKRIVDKFMEKIDVAVTERVAESTIPIFIEKVKGVYYIYNKETNDFMGQGATRDELEKNLADRFPGKRFTASTSNLKEVGF